MQCSGATHPLQLPLDDHFPPLRRVQSLVIEMCFITSMYVKKEKDVRNQINNSIKRVKIYIYIYIYTTSKRGKSYELQLYSKITSMVKALRYAFRSWLLHLLVERFFWLKSALPLQPVLPHILQILPNSLCRLSRLYRTPSRLHLDGQHIKFLTPDFKEGPRVHQCRQVSGTTSSFW